MSSRTLVVVLAALSMIGALSIDACLPALPAISHHFGVSAAVGQQSLSVYLFAFAAMTLFYGTLSDSFGRRPVILAGLSLYLAGSIGSGCARSFGWLMFFRLLQGLSAGAGSVVGRAIIADRFKGAEAERMMSYVSMVFGLAPALAPILGGWLLAVSGWRSIFLFIAVFAAVLLAICARGLPESLPPAQRHAFHFKVIVGHYWLVARHGRFLLQVVASSLAFSTLMLYVGSAPAFVLNLLHLQVTDFGWLFVPLIGGLTLGSMLAGRLSHSPEAGRRSITWGYIVLIATAVVHLAISRTMAPRLPWAVLPVAASAFGASLASPAMAIRSMAWFPKVRGLVASLQTFGFMIFFSIGSGVIAPLLFDSVWKLAAGSAVGVATSLVLWVTAGLMTPQGEPELEGTGTENPAVV